MTLQDHFTEEKEGKYVDTEIKRERYRPIKFTIITVLNLCPCIFLICEETLTVET